MSRLRKFQVWRGDREGGEFVEYEVEVGEGMVVLDVLHSIQARQAGDMALRWNCKAGKCGSCSMEINGKPRLSCMTRMNSFGSDETIRVQPLKTFPVIKDLVCDVSWNYEQNKRIKPFTPGEKGEDGKYRMWQEDVERSQEFRKCIECYLCQDVCHVLRDRDRKDAFVGPRELDATRCIAYWTVETRDPFPAEAPDLHGWVGGCDICQEVCPWNKFGVTTTEARFAPRPELARPDPDVFTDPARDPELSEALAGTPLQRTGSAAVRRSARRVLGLPPEE